VPDGQEHERGHLREDLVAQEPQPLEHMSASTTHAHTHTQLAVLDGAVLDGAVLDRAVLDGAVVDGSSCGRRMRGLDNAGSR